MRPGRPTDPRARRVPGLFLAFPALLATALVLGSCTATGPAPAAHTPGTSHHTPPPPKTPSAIPPRAGATASGVLRKGETVVHTVHLEAGDYLEAYLDRDSYKVDFVLWTPDSDLKHKDIGWGEPALDLAGETLWGVAQESGDYRLTGRLLARGEPGPYRITIVELHSAGDAEKARQAGEHEWELGVAAKAKGRFDEALGHLSPALEAWKKADYLRGVAATHGRIGRCLLRTDHLNEAAAHFREAIELWDQAGDVAGATSNLVLLANVETERHRWTSAETALQRATALAPHSLVPESPGTVLTGLCMLQRARGDVTEAIETCHQAMAFLEGVGDISDTKACLNQLGLIYRKKGEFELAKSAYQRILAIVKKNPDPSLEASTHNNLGTLYYSMGEFQKALVEFQTSLDMYRDQENVPETAARYYSIGTVYQRVGDLDTTLRYYLRARNLQEQFDTTDDLVYTLLGIGWVHALRGETALAVEPMSRALKLSRESGSKPLLVVALRRMAFLLLAEDRPEEALGLIKEALAMARQIQNRWQESQLLTHLASAQLKMDRVDEALATLEVAVGVNDATGNWRNLADNYYQMAKIYRSRGDLDTSRQRIERAIQVADQARTQIDTEEVRSLVGATQQEYPGFYIDLLMDLETKEPGHGNAASAFRAAERARARSLIEVLSSADLDTAQDAPPEMLERRDALRRSLAIAERRWDAASKSQAESANPDEIFQTKVELDSLVTKLNEVERELRSASPRYDVLTGPAPVTVQETQKALLDHDTALLEFRLGEERSFLFLVTPQDFQTFELPERSALEEDARCIHWLLAAFSQSNIEANGESDHDRTICLGSRYQELERLSGLDPFHKRARQRRLLEEAFQERASMLSRQLLGKAFRSGLLEGRRLAVVADGALEYVPFAALPEPGTREPLVARHELASLPSASVLEFQRSQTHPQAIPHGILAVIADPLYDPDDERIESRAERSETFRDSLDSGHYSRLPYASEEAKAIAALTPPEETMVKLGPEAAKESVVGSRLSDYLYIHFAVHGVIDTDYPALSRLVLSQVDGEGRPVADGALRLHDIYDMHLNAQMVVLSACDTALGQEVRGEGLIGLARGFMFAGAQRVVASLWRVQDEATARLMARFYKGLLEEHRNPADALRRAQLAMLADDDGRYAFPYYWAGFVLQGDWR